MTGRAKFLQRQQLQYPASCLQVISTHVRILGRGAQRSVPNCPDTVDLLLRRFLLQLDTGAEPVFLEGQAEIAAGDRLQRDRQ